MLCLAVNPTMDRQVFTSSLVPGSVSRSQRDTVVAGGKPINAARAALAVDGRVRLVALLPAEGSDVFSAELLAEGLACESLTFPGAIRQTIVLFEDSGRTTVINSPGAAVPPDVWRRYCDLAARSAKPGECVVVSGSFPPGVGQDQVDHLVTAVRGAGSRLAVDTGPAWLGWLVASRPDLVAPNLAEATACLTEGPAIESVEVADDALPRAVWAADRLVQAGARQAVVTAGAVGLAWATPNDSGQMASLALPVASPIGAGDALLGGLVAQLEAGVDFAQAIRWGVACAASAIGQWVPGRVDPEGARRWYEALAASD